MNTEFKAFEPSIYEVSYFRNLADNKPITIDITRFFNAVKRCQFVDQIRSIRQEKYYYKKLSLKKKLPAITTAGIFKNGRKLENLYFLSGLISIDIDNLKDALGFQQVINKDKYTFCSFISPSGNGLKIIFKVNCQPKNFGNSFLAIEMYFKQQYNTIIDTACKDITRLMFISSDSNLYYNPDSDIFFHQFYPEKPKAVIPDYLNYKSSLQNIEKLIQKIESTRIDITSSYNDWIKIAFSLIDQYGTGGLSYFHRISQFYPFYNPDECTKQYHKCLKSGSKSTHISTLYEVAKWHGISFKD